MLSAEQDKKHRIIQIFHHGSRNIRTKKKKNDSDLGIILQVEHDKYSYRIFHMGYTFINAREEKFEVEGKEARRWRRFSGGMEEVENVGGKT